jgi:hypothetical protein
VEFRGHLTLSETIRALTFDVGSPLATLPTMKVSAPSVHETFVRDAACELQFMFSVRPTVANATTCFQIPSSWNNNHDDS